MSSIFKKRPTPSTLRVVFYDDNGAPLQGSKFILTTSVNAVIAIKAIQALVSAAVFGNYDTDEGVKAYTDFFTKALTTGGSVQELDDCIRKIVERVPKDPKAKHGFIAKDHMLYLRFNDEQGAFRPVRVCALFAPDEEDLAGLPRGSGLLETELQELAGERFADDVTDAVAVAKSVGASSTSAMFKSHLAGYILSMPNVKVVIEPAEKGQPSSITVVMPSAAAADTTPTKKA